MRAGKERRVGNVRGAARAKLESANVIVIPEMVYAPSDGKDWLGPRPFARIRRIAWSALEHDSQRIYGGQRLASRSRYCLLSQRTRFSFDLVPLSYAAASYLALFRFAFLVEVASTMDPRINLLLAMLL